MTRITDVLRERRYAAFSAEVNSRMKRLGLTPASLGLAIYGAGPNGTSKSGGQVYNIIRGKTRGTRKTLERWAPVLEMTVDELLALYDQLPPDSPSGVRAAKPDSPTRGAPATVDAIALTVGQDGRATLRMHLDNIDLSVALRIIAIYTGEET